MSIYAKIESGVVTNIVVAEDDIANFSDKLFVKITEDTKSCAIGYSYDSINNKFIAKKPYPSWILNENFDWESPKGPNPNILSSIWNEDLQDWETLS